jgi:hypothetical protein
VSYVVSLQKEGGISVAGLRLAIEGDFEFTIAEESGQSEYEVFELSWQAPDSDSGPEYFMLDHGRIDITTPSNGALRKLQSLAEKLGAEVIGEEGETLTDVNVPDVPEGGCGPAIWTFFVLAVFLVIYWLID